jgi:hypothetical protein
MAAPAAPRSGSGAPRGHEVRRGPEEEERKRWGKGWEEEEEEVEEREGGRW